MQRASFISERRNKKRKELVKSLFDANPFAINPPTTANKVFGPPLTLSTDPKVVSSLFGSWKPSQKPQDGSKAVDESTTALKKPSKEAYEILEVSSEEADKDELQADSEDEKAETTPSGAEEKKKKKNRRKKRTRKQKQLLLQQQLLQQLKKCTCECHAHAQALEAEEKAMVPDGSTAVVW